MCVRQGEKVGGAPGGEQERVMIIVSFSCEVNAMKSSIHPASIRGISFRTPYSFLPVKYTRFLI